MKHYDSTEIEKKWQHYWAENNTYTIPDSIEGKENFYALSEFSYPSGNLHVGHWYAFAVPDIYARYKRMTGYNVLYPMGFDSFGLPAENAAIKRDLDPRKWTYENMEYMQGQLRSMGAMFDWDRTLATSDPEYYKWTQWMFTEFYKNGLVNRASTKVNWCETDKTILANEQVTGGECERCGNEVVQKDMAQWMFKITDFADELVDDLDDLDWDESIKQAQREWIGRKEGSEISFQVVYHSELGSESKVFGEPVEGSTERNLVKILLRNSKGEILLFEEERFGMDLPGGHVEDGESIQDAAVRELKEETIYTNFKFVQAISQNQIHYYHMNKDSYHHGQISILLYELENEEISAKDLQERECITKDSWVDASDLVKEFLVKDAYSEALHAGVVKYAYSDIDIFTTRADTLFGATYVVLAPEHQMVQGLKDQIQNREEVEAYLKEVEKKSDLDRQQSKEKTGVELKGVTAINPATNAEISVWVADYVLGHFGTGAVMAVPAHDERDCEFAIKYDLPFKFVVLPSAGDMGNSRPLVTSGENAFIVSAGMVEEPGQKRINAEWNAMYDMLGEVHDAGGVLPVGKRFCCTFEGKLINSEAVSGQKADPVFLGFNHPQPNKEWKKRKRIYALVKQKGADMYLGLQSLTDGTQGLITGGVDKGESPDQTAIREVLEETGYTTQVVRKEAYKIFDKYYSTNKDLNMSSVGDVYVLEVDDIKDISEISEEESKKAKGIWLNKEDFINWINPPSHKYIVSRYFNLPIHLDAKNMEKPPVFNAKTSEEVRPLITEHVDGVMKKTYRLRDWGISRQRYWGCPIPMVYDPDGNAHPVPTEHLPWTLPDDVDFTPDGTAPLARSEVLKKRTVEIFGQGWTPEVDTMDTFVDSSWYFYRYLDNKNNDSFASVEALKNWMPVDMYFGGAEHTTMHLLYSRFWTKALHKLGHVDHTEPYRGRLNRGLILGPDGAKMSKSKGNVIDPDEVVKHVGADAVRMYLAFIGPFNEPGNYPWDPNGVVGVRRFIERVWRLADRVTAEPSPDDLEKLVHKTIKKVTDDVERLKLNTAISSMMVLVNAAEKTDHISQGDYESLLKMFAVFAPHAAEELWQETLGHQDSIHLDNWPIYNEDLCTDDEITLGVQINGKVRSEITIPADAASETVQDMVLQDEVVQKWMDGKDIKKFIYVPGRIINIVI